MEIAILLIRIGVGMDMLIFGISVLLTNPYKTESIPNEFWKVIRVTPGNFFRIQAGLQFILGAYLLSGVSLVAVSWCVFAWKVVMAPFNFWSDWRLGVSDIGIIFSLSALVFLLS